MAETAERQRIFEQTVSDKGAAALLGRQAVSALVAIGVSEDESAIGRVAGTMIDQVQSNTGPIDIITPEDEIRIIEAAADLAREIEKQAHDETIEVLRARIAELEGLVDADVTALTRDMTAMRHENTTLSQTIKSKDDALADKSALLDMFRQDKADRDLADFQASQEVAVPDAKTLRQRLTLGARSVGNYFMKPAVESVQV